MWNAAIASRLDDWYATPEGNFALCQEYRLFQRMVSSWPRRGNTLLEVNCGSGVFLEMLWEYGFDVTGLDSVPELLNLAGKRLGRRADFQYGFADHLPYEDKSLDYVSLISTLEYETNPQDVLEEALRVARRGVLVGFLNRWSVYKGCQRLPGPWKTAQRRGAWLDPLWVGRTARARCPSCAIHSRSVLLGPPASWHKGAFWGRINAWELPFPVGAYVGMRIDICPGPPLTSIPLHVNATAPSASG